MNLDENTEPQELQQSAEPIADSKADAEAPEIAQKSSTNEVIQNEMPLNVEPKTQIRDESDQKLYEEILEKLDIKRSEKGKENDTKVSQEDLLREKQKNETQPKVEKPEAKFQPKNKIEQSLVQNFDKIQKFVQAGLIDSAQGQNLKKQVLKKAFDELVQAEKIKRALLPALGGGVLQKQQPQKPLNPSEVFEEFSRENPDFFSSEGRKDVLSYLKSSNAVFAKDELSKISEIIRTVEKAAIDKYLQNAAYEKNLRVSNDSAKQKLIANAQKSSVGTGLSRTFTREQIGKMSATEFTKYEAAIMEQLKKGRIK